MPYVAFLHVINTIRCEISYFNHVYACRGTTLKKVADTFEGSDLTICTLSWRKLRECICETGMFRNSIESFISHLTLTDHLI